MKYTYRWCDNYAARMRGCPDRPDIVETLEIEADNDADALREIMSETGVGYYDEEDIAESDAETLLIGIDQFDIGGGDPFVFWIKRGDEEIYNAGVDEDEFVSEEDDADDFDEEEEEED